MVLLKIIMSRLETLDLFHRLRAVLLLHRASFRQLSALPLRCSSVSTQLFSQCQPLPIWATHNSHLVPYVYPNRHICFNVSLLNATVVENAMPSELPKMENNTICIHEILENLSHEEKKRLKVLHLEYEVLLSSGTRVPQHITEREWLQILRDYPTVSSRRRLYSYMFKREKMQASALRKSEERKKLQEAKLNQLEQMHHDGTYEFLNTMFLFIREQTMNKWYQNNMCYSLINGPHLVFDFSFENQMTDLEITDLVRQMQHCHGNNKVVSEPFHFHFCNLAPRGKLAQKLLQAIPNLSELPITITAENYMNYYPPSRLVYLSPNAPTTMTHFEADDIYVIGGIVDRAVEEPLTFAKAKKEKIRTVRFPLDHYVRWVQGSKSLTLNQVVNILLELKHSNEWRKALLRHLPKRKFMLE